MSNYSTHALKLRIESVRGSPVNDYRITDEGIEMRTLDPSGHEYPGHGSDWRILDENEIQLHHALQTVVSVWMNVRLGDDASVFDQAA